MTLSRKKSIGLLGAPMSSGNRGVIALGVSLANLLSDANEDAQVVLFLHQPTRQCLPLRFKDGLREVEVYNNRLSLKSGSANLVFIVFASLLYRVGLRSLACRLCPWVEAASKLSLVGDVRGGDSFSDIYGWRRYLTGFAMAWSMILVCGDLVQLPQTYGPFKTKRARWMARFLLKRSSVIVARDTDSQKVAKEVVGEHREILLSPDVAFSLRAHPPAEARFEPALDLATAPVAPVGVNINALMYFGGYKQSNDFGLSLEYRSFAVQLLTALAAAHSGPIILVPHTYSHSGDIEDDPTAIAKVVAELKPEVRARVHILTGEYDQHELKWVISRCDFFVGSRMHSCIAALSQGVPCVGVAYSMKFKGVFASVGLGDWVIDGRTYQNEGAIEAILGLYRQRNAVRGALKDAGDRARIDLQRVFKAIATHTR